MDAFYIGDCLRALNLNPRSSPRGLWPGGVSQPASKSAQEVYKDQTCLSTSVVSQPVSQSVKKKKNQKTTKKTNTSPRRTKSSCLLTHWLSNLSSLNKNKTSCRLFFSNLYLILYFLDDP